MDNFFSSLTLPKWVLLGLSPIFSTILSLRLALIGLCIFVLLDLYTGIRKYMFNNNIKFEWTIKYATSIRSAGLRDSYNKIGEYLFTILMVIIFESLVLRIEAFEIQGVIFSFSEIAVILACSIELWSLFENREVYKKTNPLKKMLKAIISIKKILK